MQSRVRPDRFTTAHAIEPLRGARIAYVVNSLEGGGAAFPIPRIGAVLAGCGAQVRVFALTLRDGRGLPPIERAGFDPVVRDGGERDHIAAARWLVRETRAWGATHLWTSLSRATLVALALAPRLDTPVICWQHNAFLKPANRRLLRFLQRRATLWVADSWSVADLTRDRLGVDPPRLATWPIYAADPAQPQAKPWRPGQTLQLGSMGRLHAAKGYDVLLAALSRLRAHGFTAPVPFSIRIAGEGAERTRLEHVARQSAVPMQLEGFAQDAAGFLASLHLYLQPSRREGFCIAAHEAMTAALPVIASRTGELAHSTENGITGWLVTPEDVDDLAAALRAALSRPDALSALGQTARMQVCTQYSQHAFTQTGIDICQRIAALTQRKPE